MNRLPNTPTGTLGGEHAYCPACEYEHERQPDWLCPLCGLPVETEAWRSAVRTRVAGQGEELGFPIGSIFAGAILAATGLVLAIGLARDPATVHRWPLVAVIVLLLALGLELLFKVNPARWVAIAIAVVAAILASEDALRARLPGWFSDPLPPALRAALHGVIEPLFPWRIALVAALNLGALVLLAGRPGRWRIAIGALVAAPLPVVEVARWLLQ